MLRCIEKLERCKVERAEDMFELLVDQVVGVGLQLGSAVKRSYRICPAGAGGLCGDPGGVRSTGDHPVCAVVLVTWVVDDPVGDEDVGVAWLRVEAV